MKRIISLMLALLMISFVLVSCGSTTNPSDTTPDITDGSEPTETTPEEPEETLPPLKPEEETVLSIIKNKRTEAKIIYPEGSYEAEEMAKTLRLNLITKYTTNLGTASDAEIAPDSNAIEILIGNTNRPESDTASKYIKYNSFGVIVIGNKLVLSGWFADTVQKAVDKFTEDYVSESGSTLTVSSDDNYAPSGFYKDSAKRIFGAKYSDYKIVVSKDCTFTEYRFAQRLQTMIGLKTGAVVLMVNDTEPATEKEILVGKTNRTSSNEEKHKYSVTVKGKTVELISDSYYGYDYLYNYCEASLLYDIQNSTADCGVLLSESYAEALEADGSTSFLSKSGDLRIIYNNVFGFNGLLGTTPGKSCMPELRNPMIAEFYLDFGADVLCFEEMGSAMRVESPVTELLAPYGYLEATAGLCTTPIIYNTNTLELVEGAEVNFSQALASKVPYSIQGDKYMTWAVFKVKATGKLFSVINVHMDSFDDVSGDGHGAVKAAAEVQLMISTANDIATKHKCPLLMGGDFNTTISEPTHATLTKSFFTDIQTVAKVSDSNKGHFHGVKYIDYNSCMGGGFFIGEKQTDEDYAKSVDHIYANLLGSKDLTFERFDILSDASVASFADHCGMVLDFSFKK